MSERIEWLLGLDHRQGLAEVLVDRTGLLIGGSKPELTRIDYVVSDAYAVDRSQDPIKRTRGKNSTGRVGEPVRLSQLDARQDAEIFELRPTAFDRIEVAGDVDRVLAGVNMVPFGVLGEGYPRKAELQGALTAAFHVPTRSVPRPFGVHVEVRRQGHWTRLAGAAKAAALWIESPPWGTWCLELPIRSAGR